MSRTLPSRPNLEHLRKQAKELLHEWQRRDPAIRLADAQHAIAQEYGFASWPQLKAHVESLSRAGEQSPFVGAWATDVSKSPSHRLNQFERARVTLDVMGDNIILTSVQVSEAGRVENFGHAIHADDCEHPTGSAGHVRVARRIGTRVLETVVKQDGQIIGKGRYEVSADGKRLTISASHGQITADGWHSVFEETLVFDRVS